MGLKREKQRSGFAVSAAELATGARLHEADPEHYLFATLANRDEDPTASKLQTLYKVHGAHDLSHKHAGVSEKSGTPHMDPK